MSSKARPGMPESQGRPSWWRPTLAGAAVMVLVVAGGCRRAPKYSQETPDDTVKSAVAMVRNGDADRLGDLIYADGPEMRVILKRLGLLLGHMQDLAAAIQTKMPEQVAQLKAKAEQAATDGTAASLLAQLTGGGGGLGKANRQQRAQAEEEFQGLASAIFADPYGWIERNANRLSTMKVTDDLATVLVDDKPVLQPIGIPLRLEGDNWYVSLPTNLAAQYMPRTRGQWSIVGSMIKVLDNTALELADDVRAGRIRDLETVGRRAQDKAMIPAMMAFAAYASEMDVRRRVDSAMHEYRARAKDWVKSRPAVDGSAGVSPALIKAMEQIAVLELDKAVRKHKRPALEGSKDVEFEAIVSAWLTAHELEVRLDGPLSGESVEAAVAAWEAKAGKELAKR